jgi:hypothetical protein
MNESEKTSSGKKAAISLMFTRSKLETFAIFVELLITVGTRISDRVWGRKMMCKCGHKMPESYQQKRSP